MWPRERAHKVGRRQQCKMNDLPPARPSASATHERERERLVARRCANSLHCAGPSHCTRVCFHAPGYRRTCSTQRRRRISSSSSYTLNWIYLRNGVRGGSGRETRLRCFYPNVPSLPVSLRNFVARCLFAPPWYIHAHTVRS